MQTKKRAKPVKFGKPKEEKLSKETAEADINSDEAKEIKQIIEEKTHPKDAASDAVENNEKDDSTSNVEENPVEALSEEKSEPLEDEPEEIKLSKEPEDEEDEEEDKEDKMALESTEPITEVEADELQEKEETAEKEEEKSSAFGSFTKEEVTRKKKKGYFGFFLLVATITFVVGLLIIGGLSYFLSTGSNGTTGLTSFKNATPTPAAEPTATPAPKKADLSAYSIRVLNGSGITGEAAKVKDELEGKGFTIASVGNAATSDYTKTVISAKEDTDEAYLNELIKALQDQYSVNSVVEDAPSTQTADVVVTVGSDSSE